MVVLLGGFLWYIFAAYSRLYNGFAVRGFFMHYIVRLALSSGQSYYIIEFTLHLETFETLSGLTKMFLLAISNQKKGFFIF